MRKIALIFFTISFLFLIKSTFTQHAYAQSCAGTCTPIGGLGDPCNGAAKGSFNACPSGQVCCLGPATTPVSGGGGGGSSGGGGNGLGVGPPYPDGSDTICANNFGGSCFAAGTSCTNGQPSTCSNNRPCCATTQPGNGTTCTAGCQNNACSVNGEYPAAGICNVPGMPYCCSPQSGPPVPTPTGSGSNCGCASNLTCIYGQDANAGYICRNLTHATPGIGGACCNLASLSPSPTQAPGPTGTVLQCTGTSFSCYNTLCCSSNQFCNTSHNSATNTDVPFCYNAPGNCNGTTSCTNGLVCLKQTTNQGVVSQCVTPTPAACPNGYNCDVSCSSNQNDLGACTGVSGHCCGYGTPPLPLTSPTPIAIGYTCTQGGTPCITGGVCMPNAASNGTYSCQIPSPGSPIAPGNDPCSQYKNVATCATRCVGVIDTGNKCGILSSSNQGYECCVNLLKPIINPNPTKALLPKNSGPNGNIPIATPNPTCIPRPACLDSIPRCAIPERADWCPPTSKPTTVPSPQPTVCLTCGR